MPSAPASLEVISLLSSGPIDYHDAWETQRDRVEKIQRGEAGDALFLLEHAPTVTYGKASKPEYRRLTPEQYAARGIDLVATDRGGDVTYHGPGQLVGYPVVFLGEGRRDLHRYVRLLEDVILESALEMGVAGARRVDFHAGVWVDDRYLAAIGVRVSRWVAFHGFAINIDERVRENFSTIVACGVEGKSITTMEAETRADVALTDVADIVGRRFARSWGRW